MSQFDYLRSQLSGDTWIGKDVLSISNSVLEAIEGGKDWYFNLPHIKYIMETPTMSGIAALLNAGGDLADTVVDTNLVFLETVHGINRSFNSKLFRNNLAGKGNSEIALLPNTAREQAIYLNAVTAHNETLNLPYLSLEVAKIEAQIAAIQDATIGAAGAQIQDWTGKAQQSLEDAKNSLLELIETLKGNPRRAARRKLKIAEAGLTAMRTKNIPNIIAENPYSIDSIYKGSIESIYRTNIQANAIAPIAVGGAATIAGAAAVLTGIAGWLLNSFFLKSAIIPATLLPAMTNTVASIVLKIMGSSGAEAVRYFAASALKAGENLLPMIFGIAGMRVSGWAWLMAYASPIIAASVIIIQAMRNKLGLAESLYVFADLEGLQDRYSLSQSFMQDTNRVEILEEFKDCAKSLYKNSRHPYSQIIGVGLDAKRKYAGAYNLTDPNNPIMISGDEAIEAALGPEKVAKLKSGNFNPFSWE